MKKVVSSHAPFPIPDNSRPRAWRIYIWGEGHWPIPGRHKTREAARAAYLSWANRVRLPAKSFISEGEV